MKRQRERLDRVASRRYESLNAGERLRLVVKHAASGNADEAERVAAATPARAYSMGDAAYLDRFKAMRDLLREMSGAVTSAKINLSLMGELRSRLFLAVPAAISGWTQCRGGPSAPPAATGPPPGWKSAETGFRAFQAACQPLEDVLHDTFYIPVLKHLDWSWRAFQQCCDQRLGMDARSVFQAGGDRSGLRLVDRVVEELEALGLGQLEKDDAEAIEAIRTRFDRLFADVEQEEGK